MAGNLLPILCTIGNFEMKYEKYESGWNDTDLQGRYTRGNGVTVCDTSQGWEAAHSKGPQLLTIQSCSILTRL
jgi:hypothetical protein